MSGWTELCARAPGPRAEESPAWVGPKEELLSPGPVCLQHDSAPNTPVLGGKGNLAFSLHVGKPSALHGLAKAMCVDVWG